eukprot:gene19819-26504_t
MPAVRLLSEHSGICLQPVFSHNIFQVPHASCATGFGALRHLPTARFLSQYVPGASCQLCNWFGAPRHSPVARFLSQNVQVPYASCAHGDEYDLELMSLARHCAVGQQLVWSTYAVSERSDIHPVLIVPLHNIIQVPDDRGAAGFGALARFRSGNVVLDRSWCRSTCEVSERSDIHPVLIVPLHNIMQVPDDRGAAGFGALARFRSAQTSTQCSLSHSTISCRCHILALLVVMPMTLSFSPLSGTVL